MPTADESTDEAQQTAVCTAVSTGKATAEAVVARAPWAVPQETGRYERREPDVHHVLDVLEIHPASGYVRVRWRSGEPETELLSSDVVALDFERRDETPPMALLDEDLDVEPKEEPDVPLSGREQLVVSTLTKRGPMTANELDNVVPFDAGPYLSSLYYEGVLGRDGEGVRGEPYIYYVK